MKQTLRLLAILTAAAAAAPAAQPHITAVVSAADFAGGIAYRGLGTVFGSDLADGSYAATLPFPKRLGSTELFVCLGIIRSVEDVAGPGCEPLQLIYASPTQVNFLMYDNAPQKPWFADGIGLYIVARVSGALNDRPATAPETALSNLNGPAPRVFLMQSDRYIDSRFITPTTFQTRRGAVTDQQGHLVNSQNPARVGQYYTIWLTGLGQFTNGKTKSPLSMTYADVPVYGFKGATYFDAPVAFAGPSPQFPGLDQINFQLSPTVVDGRAGPWAYGSLFPCADYQWEITLDISQAAPFPLGAADANPIQIPVLVKRGDVACAQ
jgi:uncharacterized protein (TIGR03437 family)